MHLRLGMYGSPVSLIGASANGFSCLTQSGTLNGVNVFTIDCDYGVIKAGAAATFTLLAFAPSKVDAYTQHAWVEAYGPWPHTVNQDKSNNAATVVIWTH